ncbi:MAG: Retroviral aspartyl protease [archaeon]|nr:Retroviral aspartyl protease [archaeon]
MGYIKVKAKIANPQERNKYREIELLADTGAIYTLLPSSLLKGLAIPATSRRKFKLASGEVKDYPTGEAYIEVEGTGVTSIVVFGPEGSTSLLGVTTLKLLGFQVDPLTGKLKPMELLLLYKARDV